MRSTILALVSGAAALSLQKRSDGEPLKYIAPALEEPVGIEADEADPFDAAKLVTCSSEVSHYVKVLFNTMMGCNRPKPADKTDAHPMCDNYADGGCDNELCHDFCHQLYTSEESYKNCKCNDWVGDSFKEHAPGAPCPLKTQPRCFGGDMYRSECEAAHATGASAADMTVVPVGEWPEGDKSAVKKGAPQCAA